MKDPDHHAEQLPDHLKEFSQELKQQFTHIEQQPPNKPNFLMVVLLSGAAIIGIFILALVVLYLTGGKFGSHSFRKHPTSQLAPNSAPKPASVLLYA